MIEADRVLSTPPKNTSAVSTRRSFLSQTAGIAAGGAARHDAHDWLEAAKARFDADDRRVAVWYDANPEPTGKRARKRWARRWRENHDVVVGQSWAEQLEAEKHFRDALIAVAVIRPRDMKILRSRLVFPASMTKCTCHGRTPRLSVTRLRSTLSP